MADGVGDSTRNMAMGQQGNGLRGFMVNVAAVEATPGAYRVSYVPRGLPQGRVPAGRPKRVPEYQALVPAEGKAPVIWDEAPAEQEEALGEFTEDARKRVAALRAW